MKHRLTLPALLAAAVLTLAGCADDSDAGSDANFNDADVTFAQGMIVHHQQAVEMAMLAEDRATSPEVRELAAAIEEAQDPEIETMTGWLNAWGADIPEGDMGDMGGMDHGDMSDDDMSGMMGADEMRELEAAEGSMFDQMFLMMMIEHHEGAVEAAQTEQAEGENPDALALAEKIEADQTAEIEAMQDLLDS